MLWLNSQFKLEQTWLIEREIIKITQRFDAIFSYFSVNSLNILERGDSRQNKIGKLF